MVYSNQDKIVIYLGILIINCYEMYFKEKFVIYY